MNTTTAFDRVVNALEAIGHHVNGAGRQRTARCPAHEDRAPSLSITDGESRVLINCHAGCPVDDVLAALNLTRADMFDTPKQGTDNGFQIRESYRYTDESKRLLFTVHRCATADTNKTFRQQLPNGTWKVGNVRRVLYRLPAVVEAVGRGQTIYIVEGERDVHALEAVDVVATCNSGGAGKWRDEYSSIFKGHKVVVVADRDQPGRDHAEQVRKSLESAGATVTVVEAATGKDAADHLGAGHTVDEFVDAFPVSAPIGEKHGNTDPPLYSDVAALLEGGLPDPPAPVLLRRNDGHCVFYGGQVNLIFGDPESGKTMVAQAACAEALKAGRRVVFVDIDHNGLEATIYRFLDMDVEEKTLSDPGFFRYVEPEDRAHLAAVIEDLKQWKPHVAVIDSIGELLPLLGLNSNSPDDFTTAHARVLKPLAKAGAAVLAIDHLPKNVENKINGPTGTAAKRRAVGGVSIRVVIEDQFAPGQGGSCWLSVNKDRHGGLRAHCPANPGGEQLVGIFRIAKSSASLTWSLEAPKDGEMPKDELVPAEDLAALDALNPPPTGNRDARERLRWNSTRTSRALRAWKARKQSQGAGNAPETTPPAGNADEQLSYLDHLQPDQHVSRFPSVSGNTETPETESVSVFPPYGSGNTETAAESIEDTEQPTCLECRKPYNMPPELDDYGLCQSCLFDRLKAEAAS